MSFFRRAVTDRHGVPATTDASLVPSRLVPSGPTAPTSVPSERLCTGLEGLSLRYSKAAAGPEAGSGAAQAGPSMPRELPAELLWQLPLGVDDASRLSATSSRLMNVLADERRAAKIVRYGIPTITPALDHFETVLAGIHRLDKRVQSEPWAALATRLAQAISERYAGEDDRTHTAQDYIGYANAIGRLPNEHQVDPWCLLLTRPVFVPDGMDALAPYFVQAVLSQRSRDGRTRVAAHLPAYLEHIQDRQLRSRAFDCCLDVASDVVSPAFAVEPNVLIRELFVGGLASEISFRPEENRQFEFDRVADAHDRLPKTTVTQPLKYLVRAIPSLPSIIERPRAFTRIADTVALHWERVRKADLVVILLEELSRVIPMLPHDSQNAAVDQIIGIADRLPADGRNRALQALGL